MDYKELDALNEISDIGPLATVISEDSKTLLAGIGYENFEYVHIFQHRGTLNFLRYIPPFIDHEDDNYTVLQHTISTTIPVRRFMVTIKSCTPDYCDFNFCKRLVDAGVRLPFGIFSLIKPTRPIAMFTNVAELDVR
jgi:hypothetical protein